MLDEYAINIYTDGSSLKKPRKGGMGLRIIIINNDGNEEIEDIPIIGIKGATNNQMELNACILGIREVKNKRYFSNYKKIIIYSDSQYVIKNYKNAMFQWCKIGWQNRYGKPIENASMWKDLLKEIKSCPSRIEFKWVKGHSKDKHNKAVDKMAKKSAVGILDAPINIVKVRRKITSREVEIGCVKLNGQRLTIRIITDAYMKVKKIYKYKYEVMSKASRYYGNVDIAFSKKLLNAGHVYFVKMNNDNNNPKIDKVFREIIKK